MSQNRMVSGARSGRGRVLRFVAAGGAAVLAVALAAVSPGSAGAAGRTTYPLAQNLRPRFSTDGGASVLATTRTVPHWHGSFVDGLNGQTYGYNMVGTDPASGGSTAINAEIIPLDVSFAANGGYSLRGEPVASWAAKSPIFAPTPMPTGETAQYLDSVMRSEFNQIGSGYHVQLTAGVLPTQTIKVPSDRGALYYGWDGTTVIGLVNEEWFAAQLQSVLASSHLDPATLPIFVSNDVFVYPKSVANCCNLGFHGAAHLTGLGAGSAHGNGDQDVQTYAWASWITSPGVFGVPGLTDVSSLSHEVSEWGHDPFADNYVNPWAIPGAAQYGCTNLLESGDPLVGVEFGVGPTAAGTFNQDPASGPQWHLQDEAFLWWFARNQTQASNGAYSYLGTFTSGAPTC